MQVARQWLACKSCHMKKPTLRQANGGDLDAIVAILRAAYAPYLGVLDGLPEVTALTAEDLAAHQAWLAEIDGRSVGVTLAKIAPPVAHLANVAVHPDAAGHGLGRALIDRVVAAARAAGCTRIDLATHPGMGNNVAIYTRMGWEITDVGVHKICMSRIL